MGLTKAEIGSTTICTKCGKEIFFAKLPNKGAWLPFDTEVSVATKEDRDSVFIDGLDNIKTLSEGEKGFKSHFLTCKPPMKRVLFNKSKK